MLTLAENPFPLLLPVLGLAGIGALLLARGRRMPRAGRGVAWAGILLLAGVAILYLRLLQETGMQPHYWRYGWIWPKEEPSALTLGVLVDPLSVTGVLVTVLISCVLLFQGALLERETSFPQRSFAAVLIGAAGVSLAWFSLTFWFAVLGLVFCLLSGFVAFGSKWQSGPGARMAASAAWQRGWGLLVATVGALILANAGVALFWASPLRMEVDQLGAWVLVAGLFFGLQGFSSLGWSMSAEGLSALARVALCQIFPAWGIFAVLFRIQPALHEDAAMITIAWIAVLLSVLSGLAGLFQTSWRQALTLWTVSGLGIAFGALGLVGANAAMPLLLGVSAGAILLASAGEALEGGGSTSHANRHRALFAKGLSFVGAACGTGVLGMLSVGGFIRAFEPWATPEGAAPLFFLALTVLLFSTLGWRMGWKIAQLANFTQARWDALISPVLLALLSFGVWWTGELTGGAFPGGEDLVSGSWLETVLGTRGAFAMANFQTAATLHWGILVAALLLGYWSTGRTQDHWSRWASRGGLVVRFVSSGYGTGAFGARLVRLIELAGDSMRAWIDQKIWNRWIPALISGAIGVTAEAVSAWDRRRGQWVGAMARRWFEVPVKTLQLIQCGDLQWYLLFAIGSGLAILVHFLRVKA